MDKYVDWTDGYDGIIKNRMVSYSDGVPVYLVYGDYYLADALYRLRDYFEN